MFEINPLNLSNTCLGAYEANCRLTGDLSPRTLQNEERRFVEHFVRLARRFVALQIKSDAVMLLEFVSYLTNRRAFPTQDYKMSRNNLIQVSSTKMSRSGGNTWVLAASASSLNITYR